MWASGSVAPGLWSTGSVVVACGLSRSTAGGVFPDQDGAHVSQVDRQILYH